MPQAGIQVPPRHTFSSKLTVLGIYTGIFSNTRLDLKNVSTVSLGKKTKKKFLVESQRVFLYFGAALEKGSLLTPEQVRGGIKGSQDAQPREP